MSGDVNAAAETLERALLRAGYREGDRVLADLRALVAEVESLEDYRNQLLAQQHEYEAEVEQLRAERDTALIAQNAAEADFAASLQANYDMRAERDSAREALREIIATEPDFGFAPDIQAAYSGALVIARAALTATDPPEEAP